MQDDEAYYWVYSRYLDWGYFDHPPMIAALVKMGYAIFQNEGGVRLFPLLLNILCLLVIEKLIFRKNPFLFYTIALSIAVMQVAGFIAVPDIPLIFFAACFFGCYQRFTNKLSLFNAVLLGISIAALFYSKYHAVLIVLFTLLSNIKLLSRYQTWLAAVVAFSLFAPHLWWQYQHDWVSIRYHLFESNVNPYRFSYTINYIVGQLLLPGPIAGLILLPAAFLYRPVNETEKALRSTMIGIYLFFLISSFRGKVEGNWTSPVLVSLIVLSHRYLNDRSTRLAIGAERLLRKLFPITLFLVLLARIIMIADIIPIKELRSRYHAWKGWPNEMKKRTEGLPGVFSNSYQRASKFWFYTGQMTYSQSYYRERKNNYNFWPVEDSLLGKPVYFLDIFNHERLTDSMKTSIGLLGYRYDSSFHSFAKIKFKALTKNIRVKAGEECKFPCRIELTEQYERFIRSRSALNDTTRIGLFNKNGWLRDVFTDLSLRRLVDQKTFEIKFDPGLPKGNYYLIFSINCDYSNPTHNSEKIGMTIE